MFKKLLLTVVIFSTLFTVLPVRAEDSIPPIQRLGTGIPTSIAASPDGTTLAVGSSIGVWLLDVESLQPFGFWDTGFWVNTIEYSTDGRYLRANDTVYDTSNGQPVSVDVGQVKWIDDRCSPDGVLCTQFNSDPRMTSNFDGHVLITNVRTTVRVALIKQWYIHDVTWSVDGTKFFGVMGSVDKPQGVKVWDTQTWQSIAENVSFFRKERQEIWWSIDGRLITSNGVSWVVETGDEISIQDCQNPVLLNYYCTPSPLKAWIHQVYEVDPLTQEIVRAFAPHRKRLYSAKPSPDGTLLVTSGQGSTNRCKVELCSDESSTRIWDISTFQFRTELPTWFTDSAFSPDNQTVAGLTILYGKPNNSIEAWDWKSGTRLWQVASHSVCTEESHWQWIDYYHYQIGFDDIAHNQCIATNSRYVATYVNSQYTNSYFVELRSLSTGDLIATLTGHTAPITGVAFSPDGTKIAASASDGNVLVWAVP